MAKGKGGRPRKEDGDSGTTQIRAFDDIAEMLSDLSLVLPRSIAQIVDPLLRPEITDMHARYKPQIDKIKAKQRELENAIREAQSAAAQQEVPMKKPKGSE